MHIQISESSNDCVSVKVDGIELSNYVSELNLTQKAGKYPELVLKMPVFDKLEIDLPAGVVVIDKTVDQD